RFEACWITFDEAAERVGSFDALFEYDTRVGFPPLKVVERGIFLSRPTVEALAAALAQSRDETALSGSYDRYLPVSRVLKTLGINKQRLRALMQYRVLTPRKLRGILLFSQSQLSRTNGELPPREKRFTTTWIELFEAAEMVGSQAILFLCEELKLIPPPLVRGDNVLYRRRAIDGLLARRGSGEIDRVEESMGRTSTEQALEILDLADAELLGALERSTIIQRTTDPHRPYFRAEIEWYARQMEE
ncbi:MAG: hypothetical protein IT290_09320, partial [Deltaproteobacteria bacterium]|nr:hypothetical protein [Deltaproteobacteria bacterium]